MPGIDEQLHTCNDPQAARLGQVVTYALVPKSPRHSPILGRCRGFFIYMERQLLLQVGAELGAMISLIKTGQIKPYITKAQAGRLYGRKNIERWLDEGLLSPRKDGNHSAGWRIDRFELELIVKARFLLQHLDL